MFDFKKKFSLSLLALGMLLPAVASDCVKVSDAKGENVYFLLADKPVVTFTSDHLVLTTVRQTLEYPIQDYRSFVFADAPTGILAATSVRTPLFSIGSSLRAEGLEAGSRVAVYDAEGVEVASAKASDEGTVNIPLNGWKGIYVVKSSTKSFKFIRK